MLKTKTKEHYFVSRTGAMFVLAKFGDNWYLAGNPMHKDSEILWPTGAGTNFKRVSSYVKTQLGLIELK